MIIDTHTHLYHKRFDDDRDEVVERARAAGVGVLLLPAIDVESIGQALNLCSKHEGIFAMAAIHPSDVKESSDADLAEVRRMAADERIVAIGETGLDYYWDRSFDEKQQDYFRWHIRLALELDLPIVIHNREATEDVLQILEEERKSSDVADRMRGVLHCFGGPVEVVARAVELGFYFGIGGTVTYKNSGVADVVRAIPAERLLVETDAPFLAPVPHRGKRNEPAFIAEVVRQIADARAVSVSDVELLTTSNAMRLFRIGA